MIHGFDEEVAMDVGINAAILYKNIQFWCEHNRTNNQHFHDGFYWTFNSMKAFADQFPYLSEAQVRQALKVLEQKGYIKSGNFNKQCYDRTKWYADIRICRLQSKETEDSICHPSQMDLLPETNGFDTDVKPIPDINTDINTDVNSIYISADENFLESLPDKPQNEVLDDKEKMFLEFWELYPKKVDKEGSRKAFKRIKKLKEVFPGIIRAIEIQKQSKQWNQDNGQYIPNPKTYINQERWLTVNEADEIQAYQNELVLQDIQNFNLWRNEDDAQ